MDVLNGTPEAPPKISYVPVTPKSQVAFAGIVNPASTNKLNLIELLPCNSSLRYWVVNPQVADGLGVIVIVGVTAGCAVGLGVIVIVGVTSGVGVLLGVIDGVLVGCAVGVGLG